MLICNPLNNSYFLPLASSFSLMLALGFLGVILGRAASKDETLKRQLLLRWQSWFAIAIITLLALLSGTVTMALLSSSISAVCVLEFARLTRRNSTDLILLLLASVIMPFMAALLPAYFPAAVFLLALVLVSLCLSKSESFESSVLSLAAFFYLPVLSSHAVLLYKSGSEGPALLAAVVCASALSNIFAFVFGKVLKGPKLAPLISPNKTWWGVLGSLCGAYLGFHFILLAAGVHAGIWLSALVPPVVAFSGVLGDLFESQLKRSFHAKDAGTWLPGFGGALDRVDGLLFVLPSVYYLFAPVL